MWIRDGAFAQRPLKRDNGVENSKTRLCTTSLAWSGFVSNEQGTLVQWNMACSELGIADVGSGRLVVACVAPF